MIDLKELEQGLMERFRNVLAGEKKDIAFPLHINQGSVYPPPQLPQLPLSQSFLSDNQIMHVIHAFFAELAFKEQCGSHAPSHVLVSTFGWASEMSSQIGATSTKVITAAGAQWDYWGTQMSQVLPEICFIGRVSKQLQELPPGFYVWVGHFYDEKGAPNISGDFRSLTSDELKLLSVGKIPWS